MFPGTKLTLGTVASAASIIVKSDIVKVTGTTQINTITSPLFLSAQGGLGVILIPVDGSVVLGTSGNILVGITAVINRAVFMTYDTVVGKWYINSGV